MRTALLGPCFKTGRQAPDSSTAHRETRGGTRPSAMCRNAPAHGDPRQGSPDARSTVSGGRGCTQVQSHAPPTGTQSGTAGTRAACDPRPVFWDACPLPLSDVTYCLTLFAEFCCTFPSRYWCAIGLVAMVVAFADVHPRVCAAGSGCATHRSGPPKADLRAAPTGLSPSSTGRSRPP